MSQRQDEPASLTVRNIAIQRGARMVIRDFSMEARVGDIVWLRGSNGSGKTSLLRAIAGLLPVAVGTVERTGKLAMTDDAIALDYDQSLDDALRYWAKLDGASGAELEAAMTSLDLVPLAELPVRMLSAGQKRRGSLARTIASGAAIWLLDEPYNGLDQANLTRLDAAIERHAASQGIVIIASHVAPSVNVANSVMLDRTRKAA
ncbi:heme ABC exporter ATP-binding protein CcmA [Sphingorhabdus sp.]|jgi:heme exporter protein A|uniref:heme ABC exporter ATP-binding protein CcmA n=1 Tax=Sphingorhabdus sp. TaxID=1902408 RepID=UPI003BAF8A77|nr:heme ABC exporter ATP-binding protein CcmA [Sphingomonadales bacterium]MBK9433462.1 heme ABC exporter ATP-binding protein CcmA [Sphingomonadales bacterium]MBL0020903.1 heme ABC exporter ATP-binding protein CcmA [Sphingomonadales bacterium]